MPRLTGKVWSLKSDGERGGPPAVAVSRGNRRLVPGVGTLTQKMMTMVTKMVRMTMLMMVVVMMVMMKRAGWGGWARSAPVTSRYFLLPAFDLGTSNIIIVVSHFIFTSKIMISFSLSFHEKTSHMLSPSVLKIWSVQISDQWSTSVISKDQFPPSPFHQSHLFFLLSFLHVYKNTRIANVILILSEQW